jgi:hypothetical protein
VAFVDYMLPLWANWIIIGVRLVYSISASASRKEVCSMSRRFSLLVGLGLMVLLAAGCGRSSSPKSTSFLDQVAQARQEADADVRVRQLVGIGYQQAKAQDIPGAVETFQLALKDCQAIDDHAAQAVAFARVAEALVEVGERSAARGATSSAADAAEHVKDAEIKARVLTRVAMAQCALGDFSGGQATTTTAEELAATVEDVQGRAAAYCDVAGVRQKLGQDDEVDRVFGVVLSFAKNISNMKKRCLVVSEVAAKQAELNKMDAATGTFDMALELAGQIDKPYARAFAMTELAEQLSKAGFRMKAHRVLTEAEHVAAKVPEQDMQLQALQKVRSSMGKLPRS